MSTQTELQNRIHQLERERDLANDRIARLEQRLASVQPLLKEAKKLTFWDYTVYEVKPDDTWLAVDRMEAAHLLAALAEIDHWEPWSTRIEPRPQP